MVILQSVECDVCGSIYTLRISIGHSEHQPHRFYCEECEEPIGIILKIDFDEIAVEAEKYENCTPTQESGQIVNLHPELLVEEDSLSDRFAFPSVSEGLRLLEERQRKKPFSPSIFENLGGMKGIKNEWERLSRAWSLYNNGKDQLVVQQIEDRFPDWENLEPWKINAWIHGFCIDFLDEPSKETAKDVFSVIRKTKEDKPSKFDELREYYYEEVRHENFKRYRNIIGEYFENYSEYSQVVFYRSSSNPPSEDLKATNVNFDDVKMFYGNAFEVFTTSVEVLAILNNVAKGREYDTFSRMSLKKYREDVDKSKRCNPFHDIDEFHKVCDGLDSTLRNASHHRAIELDHVSGVVKYRSGGTGAERTMTYAQYMWKCNQIMSSIIIVLLVELQLSRIKYMD